MQAGLRHDTPRIAAPREGQTAQRRCIVTGEVRPRDELLRFVVDAEGRLTPDITGRLPGRGIWLSPDRDSIKRARARKLFERAARRALQIDEGLDDRIETLLASRCLELIGLARRAGQAVAGYEKVRAMLRKGRGAILLAAKDGAEDGREKVRAASPELPVLDCLKADELGRAFGRDRTVHAALSHGALADRLRIDARKLMGFRA
ncbi:MAG: RNA-binding protein [Alphaproteobacteria bacterium]|nr:RNA-binding protein [Alphaproteobacteria bacterium]